MSNLSKIARKEIKELLTPATLIPIIVIALLFGSLGGAFSGVENSLDEPPKIALINNDTEILSEVAFQVMNQTAEIVYVGNSVQEALQTLDDEDGVALFIIPSNFTSDILSNKTGTIEAYWIMKGAGIMDSLPSAVAENVLFNVDQTISATLITYDLSNNATIILNPTQLTETTIFKDKEMAGISPVTLSSVMSSQSFIMPLIVMMVIIYAGSIVISSMGSEEENKTLETLLTMPISRTSIVFGKLLGAAVVGLIMAVIYMLGMSFYFNSLMGSSSIDLAQYGLTLDLLDYVLVGASLFAALVFALALCMILGIFTKNYKAAQTMTMPVTFLAMIPMFITMFTDFDTLPLVAKILVFAIPFSHPMIAMRSLMFDDYPLVLAGIAYSTIMALLAMFVAVTLFKKDILLTGKMISEEKMAKFPVLAAIMKMSKRKRR
ncbi:MAG: ABC transporter permease [Methanomassiliicoccales archaeon]|nr:ABC transporter permease [Methanomassiliicoccales archaeon]